jgi:hypothetical protein
MNIPAGWRLVPVDEITHEMRVAGNAAPLQVDAIFRAMAHAAPAPPELAATPAEASHIEGQQESWSEQVHQPADPHA